MKRIFMTVAVALAAVTMVVAQNPQEIYEKFQSETGIANYEAAREGGSELIEATIEAGPMAMPIKMVLKHGEPTKFRMDMEAAGQNILMVFDGEAAYMTVQGQTQKITDPAQIEQMAPTSDMTGQLGPKIDDFSKLKYVGTEGKGKKECDVLEYDAGDKGHFTMHFNKATGLLDKMIIKTETSGQVVEAETLLKDYTEFADGVLLFPAVIDIKTMGQIVKMKIDNLELDYPTAPWMFAAPQM